MTTTSVPGPVPSKENEIGEASFIVCPTPRTTTLSDLNTEFEHGVPTFSCFRPKYIYTISNKNVIRREERYCVLCLKKNDKVIGSDEHAIMMCPNFETERTKLINFIGNLYPNFLALDSYGKLFFMLTCEGECVKQISKFIHTVLSTPRQHINKNSCRT